MCVQGSNTSRPGLLDGPGPVGCHGREETFIHALGCCRESLKLPYLSINQPRLIEHPASSESVGWILDLLLDKNHSFALLEGKGDRLNQSL